MTTKPITHGTVADRAHHRRGVAVVTFGSTRIFHHDSPGTTATTIHNDSAPTRMHRKGENISGTYEDAAPEYLAAICDNLRDLEHVLLIGHGKGHSNAAKTLAAFAETHHEELSKRVAGVIELDVPALSDAEILAEARRFFKAAAQRGW